MFEFYRKLLERKMASVEKWKKLNEKHRIILMQDIGNFENEN